VKDLAPHAGVARFALRQRVPQLKRNHSARGTPREILRFAQDDCNGDGARR
jgi:hypothetical protein